MNKFILFERKHYKNFPKIRFESVGDVYNSKEDCLKSAKELNLKEFKIKMATGKKDILNQPEIINYEFGY